jgi:hypothetical protein
LAVRRIKSRLPQLRRVRKIALRRARTRHGVEGDFAHPTAALTAHLVRPGAGLDDDLLRTAADGLARRFGVRHTTLQVEAGDGDQACRLAPESVI